MSNEKLRPPITANHSLSSKLTKINNSKIKGRFTESCLRQDKATYIAHKLDVCSLDLLIGFTQKDFLFGVVKLSKNFDPDKYCYSGYGIRFNSSSLYSYPSFN